jgi:hypothetical protein
MAQRLFRSGKIGCFIDTYAPAVEKRRGEAVSVLTVRMRVQPFDSKLATSLDEGVGGDSNIRPTVFSLNTSEPKPNFTRHDFKLALERQNLEIFTTPDTSDATIALLQAKISGCYVRTQKDMNALAMCFKATFGPVGKAELEQIHRLHRSQAFITFQEAEPLLEEEDDEEDGEDVVAEAILSAPMLDVGDESRPPAPKKKTKPATERAHRRLHSHQSKKKNAKRR